MVFWTSVNLHNSASAWSSFVDIAQKSRSTNILSCKKNPSLSLSIHLKRSTLTLNCCKDTWGWQETGAYIKLGKISKNDQITKLMKNMLTILWGLGQSQNSYPSTQAGFSTSPSWDLRLSSCGPCCPSVLPHRIPTSPQHIWCGHGCATVARVNFKGRVCIPGDSIRLLFPAISLLYKCVWFDVCCCSDVCYFDSLDNIITLSWCAHVPTSMNRWLNDLVITGSTLTKWELSSSVKQWNASKCSEVKNVGAWQSLDSLLASCLSLSGFTFSLVNLNISSVTWNQTEKYGETGKL